MSVTTINATTLGRAGTLDLAGTAVAVTPAGDIFANTGYQFVYINNGNASSCVVTLTANGGAATVDGQTITSKTVTILTTKTALFGPFPTSVYNDSSGNVTLTYSVTSTVKILVFVIAPNQ